MGIRVLGVHQLAYPEERREVSRHLHNSLSVLVKVVVEGLGCSHPSVPFRHPPPRIHCDYIVDLCNPGALSRNAYPPPHHNYPHKTLDTGL